MVSTHIATTIPAPPDVVWDSIADVSTHVGWMADAEEIRFVGERRAGVGTNFVCLTKIGPLSTKDRMRITHWRPNELMAIDHCGLFKGSGRFELQPADGGSATEFVWREELTFPWYFGAAAGATLAKPVLTAIWKGNLQRLADLITEIEEGEQH